MAPAAVYCRIHTRANGPTITLDRCHSFLGPRSPETFVPQPRVKPVTSAGEGEVVEGAVVGEGFGGAGDVARPDDVQPTIVKQPRWRRDARGADRGTPAHPTSPGSDR